MDLLAVRIETARLVMLPVEPAHAAAIFAAFTPEVTIHMYPQPAREIGETLAFIADARQRMAAGEEVVVAILRRESNEFLGCGGLHGLPSGAPEAGIWIKLAAQRQGFGFEAVEGLVRWAAATCAPRHVVYPVMVENDRSRRIPERLGGRLTRSFRKANAAGVVRDLVEYIIPLPLPEQTAR
jgi:[ribosomal protein S5]-alanine N-acetyltransferase